MSSEFDSWEPQEPPRGFTEKVMSEVQKKERKPRSRRPFYIGIGLIAAAAAAIVIPGKLRTPHGEITADAARVQKELGPRVIGVLEPGAHVSWNGNELTQDAGDVFYRVEPGGPLVVHTPSGDVQVLGTCFRVKVETDMKSNSLKSAAIGSALTAAAFVGVYEGKVAVSHASQSVELGPGENARVSADGVTKVDGPTAQNGSGSATGDDDDPTLAANANLADTVRDYKRRLENLEGQKSKLEKQLHEAQDKIAVQQADGSTLRSEYDPGNEEWAALAKDHKVVFRVPCPKPYNPKQDDLDKLGLAPQDAPVLTNAWSASTKRMWAGVKPICARMMHSEEVAEKVGTNTCMHLIVDISDKDDHEGTRQAFQDVGLIRSGSMPMPQNPSAVLQALMIMTGEMKNVETDVAKSLGPDEAHRILYGSGDGLCLSSSRWGM